MEFEKYIDFVIEYKNGEQKITVVNSPGVKCSDVPTDEVIKKLMGKNIEITNFDHTEQYYNEQDVKKVEDNTPHSEESFVKRRLPEQEERRHELDL
jgi:hypothetical protein